MCGNDIAERENRSGHPRCEWTAATSTVTSKLSNDVHRPDDARRLRQTLRALRGSRLRRPIPDPLAAADCTTATSCRPGECWKSSPPTAAPATSEYQTSSSAPSGAARQRATVPAVNQIEVHPTSATAPSGRTAPSTASPPRHGRRSPAARYGDPVVARIAQAVGRTPAQTVLRWHIQRGIVFPKSTSPERISQDFRCSTSELTEADMAALEPRPRASGRTGPDQFR